MQIDNYLAAKSFPQHLSSKEKKTIFHQSARYSCIEGNLSHTRPDHQIRCCLRNDMIFSILKDYHEEPCGGDFEDKRTRSKVHSIGYYWPTIFQDAKKFVKGCDSC